MKREPNLDELQTAPLELRVLYGPQSGSRLTLFPGDYQLGTSDDCTIILTGPRIEATHAKLTVEDGQTSISPIDGKINDTEGNPIEEKYNLALGMPIEIGGVWIAIDHLDAEWPDPVEVAPISPASPISHPPIYEPIVEVTEVQSIIAKFIPPHLRAKLGLFISFSVLFIILVSGISIIFSLQKNEPDISNLATAQNNSVEPQYLNDIRAKISLITEKNSIKISRNKQGETVVKGYVSNTETKNKITDIVHQHAPNSLIQIYSEPEILEAAKKLIDQNEDKSRTKITVDGINNGVLKISGSVSSASARDEVIDLFKTTIPGVLEVESSLLGPEEIAFRFETELNDLGLGKRFQILSRQPDFVLSGKLTENEIRTWENLVQGFNNNYGNLLPIRATISQIQSKPPVNVETIVGGNTPFVVTTSGQRIGRGGNINGNVLSIVRDNEIIFDGNERFRIGR
jgi:type III secretion system YscD/HrpQ family protein